jgi:hypothetical protein
MVCEVHFGVEQAGLCGWFVRQPDIPRIIPHTLVLTDRRDASLTARSCRVVGITEVDLVPRIFRNADHTPGTGGISHVTTAAPVL